METVDTIDTIELTVEITKDMVGDLFMTRGGELVCLEEWDNKGTGEYPVKIGRHIFTKKGRYWAHSITPRDLVRHLTRSKYPEHYL